MNCINIKSKRYDVQRQRVGVKQKKSESKLLDTISLLSTSPSEKCEEKKVTTVKDAYFENVENFDDTDEGWYSRDTSEGRVFLNGLNKILFFSI